MTCESTFHEQIIDGCSVRCYLTNVAAIPLLGIDIFNFEEHHTMVDLNKLRIPFQDWYYCVPFSLWVDPKSARRIQINQEAVYKKVDNLTYIEELAKEKNLV